MKKLSDRAEPEGIVPVQSGQRWELPEFRQLLDALPAGAYTCDANGLITYYNKQAVALWGREPRLNDPNDRFCGSFRLFCRDGSPIKHSDCWMALALLRNEQYNGQEIIIEQPGGQRLSVLAHANPIRDDSGKLLGAINVLVDITQRKHAENAVREADRARKDEFLATLAHELRSPLAPLRSALQIMRMQMPAGPSPESDWALDVMDRQVKHLTRLIDDLLDLSRITRNKLELRRSRVELGEVLQSAVETSRPLIDAAGVELTLTLPGQPLFLDADATRLAQAVSNLLSNSAKYTDSGGRIWLIAQRQGGDALITVRDTGIGIPPEMLPRIFEGFTHVEASLNRCHGGLGIGLALVKRLVELHGGTVQSHSDGPGTGSEFTIRLPMRIEATNRPVRADVTPRYRSGGGMKIMIVDDNRDSANTLGILLRLTGNDVRTAYGGLEGVELAAEFRPDVALMDIGMPGVNGYEAAEQIRQLPNGANTVLIALTGWGQASDKQRARDAGFDHHIVKPVDPPALLTLLSSLKQPVGSSA